MSKPKGWVGPIVTERMVLQTSIREDIVAARPEFKTGDKVRIYSGPEEDHVFAVNGVRYHEGTRWHKAGFQYERVYLNGSRWIWEDNVVSAGDRRGWHYDSQGYCDNPGRGY